MGYEDCFCIHFLNEACPAPTCLLIHCVQLYVRSTSRVVAVRDRFFCFLFHIPWYFANSLVQSPFSCVFFNTHMQSNSSLTSYIEFDSYRWQFQKPVLWHYQAMCPFRLPVGSLVIMFRFFFHAYFLRVSISAWQNSAIIQNVGCFVKNEQ